MKNPIKLGMVGIGRAGYGMHLAEMGDKGLYDIVAVCDLEADRTAEMHEKYGSKQYSRVEDIVEDPDVELIDIATRSNDHFIHAMTALQAGKAVLLEKPISLTYDQAVELFTFAEKCGKDKLFIRHNRRFEAKFMEVNKIIASGELGDVFYIKRCHTQFSRRADWQTLSQYGGGQLLNWGPHLIDQSLQFCGGDYKRMLSHTRLAAAAGDCEDVIFASFEGVNGRIVEMEINACSTIHMPEYIVYGTRGTLIDKGETYRINHLPLDYEFSEIKASAHTPKRGASFGSNEVLPFVDEERTWETNDLDHIWQYVYETIREGAVYPIKSHEALKVMEVISEIKKQNKR